MQVDVVVLGQEIQQPAYLNWSAFAGELRPRDFAGVDVDVVLRSGSSGSGRLVFALGRDGPYAEELQVRVVDGDVTPFFVAGHFPHASEADGDTSIECLQDGSALLLGARSVTVRVRKNANDLSVPERDRFLQAFATLNDQGAGIFKAFRDMHTSSSDREAHRDHGFLPWHRCYLLDLERELQNIDPSVTLPYWRFDAPAPNLFSPDFIGVPFSSSNPLTFWATDGTSPMLVRSANFNTSTSAAGGIPATPFDPGFPLINETTTLGLGTFFLDFRRMEGSPHGAAHVSFNGYIDNPATAAKDPLFFLLHCNVDRLWAKWQWLNDRFDNSMSATYPSQGSAGVPGARRIGHNLLDSMWPWNGNTAPPRPSSAPRTPFPPSPIVSAPGSTPIVRGMIDYQGSQSATDCLGFDYDDVPFEPTVV